LRKGVARSLFKTESKQHNFYQFFEIFTNFYQFLRIFCSFSDRLAHLIDTCGVVSARLEGPRFAGTEPDAVSEKSPDFAAYGMA
jgi:hypothetical protein